ncbi:hypothetical protein [Lentzea sp. DG1S-22]|uniref:hypothetical protein n=1 Tax=Lentzea sp. DG1S-22 TaxID=3108822 RepID=UPI003FA55930
MSRLDHRRTRRLTWTLFAIALTLLIAGVLVPHALLIAAGLIMAGSLGLGGKR